MRTVFINGDYVLETEAKVSIFDRGFLFADGIYEVTAVLDGKLVDFDGHFERLKRSAAALEMDFTNSRGQLLEMHRELVRVNDLVEGNIYLQVSRSSTDRDFEFPPKGTPLTIVSFTQARPIVDNPAVKKGWSIVLLDDLRWHLCDIKTVQLLYPSLAKMESKKQGADDAWLVRDGQVTEGTSNNAYIVDTAGQIITRQLSHDILHGITRKAILACAEELDLELVERAFTPDEARNAQEAFVTSATTLVMPIVRIDGQQIGTGNPGPIALKLREHYLKISRARAI